ncbi:nucleotidyltransferase domain-containing protein [Halorubrum sp. DTA98]|uniref:nucleotidyltransferase domain-containing protein n=1 Tax=Halorubrum sp. DTA98 TaxID=3402163 RepID=UPI003AAEF423
MKSSSNIVAGDGLQILLDIPAQSGELFGSTATDTVLSFLSRHHTEEFSISDLVEAVDYSQPSVSKAVTVLSENDLVVERREGNTRWVQINHERLHVPDDPYLQIPQSEFQDPVRAAATKLRSELDGLIGVVLYGSVARGEADRRSDIDLWVLVEEDRMANQRAANQVKQVLEDEEFENGRYEYEIDVEVLQAIPKYISEIREVLSDGIVIHETEKFQTVRNMVFHGDLDE